MDILFNLFELLILRPFYALMELYILLAPQKFADVISGDELSEKQLQEITAFRNEMYKEKQTYLIPQTESELKTEEEIDQRSFHAVVYDEHKEIVAVSRLTPYPFETTFILGEDRTQPYRKYLEISRLVCRKKNAGVGKRLLIKVGLYAIRTKRYDGFIAICRDANYRIFQKFGLRTIYKFNYDKRGTEYNFICADFFKVSTSAIRHFRMKLVNMMSSIF